VDLRRSPAFSLRSVIDRTIGLIEVHHGQGGSSRRWRPRAQARGAGGRGPRVGTWQVRHRPTAAGTQPVPRCSPVGQRGRRRPAFRGRIEHRQESASSRRARSCGDDVHTITHHRW
jgi:hypothetical protein